MTVRLCNPMPSRRNARLIGAVLISLLTALTACGGSGADEGAASAGPGSSGSGTGAGPSTSPAAGPTSSKLFIESTWRTSNARIALDANGGKHVAFYYYEPNIEQRPTGAAYRYCAKQCNEPSSWQEVRFGALARSVQLKLTADGKPRLLVAVASQVYDGGNDYLYAACDANCTRADAWSVTTIFSGRVPATNLVNDDELPQRGFALDALGRPRLVVFDENQLVSPEHYGLYYLSCDQQCSEATQWTETLMTVATRYEVERVSQPALSFTPDGRPRVASAQFFPLGGKPAALVYLACDDGCDQTANWGRVELMPRGFGSEPSVDIAVDQGGRPRIAFYQEALLEGQGKRLFYLSCDQACLERSNWQALDLQLNTFNGQEPDLELDSFGRPRIAYADWERGGIGFSWCDQDCAGASRNWQHRLVEDRDALYKAWPVAYPPHCTGGLWNTLTPTLALSVNSAAQIAFDATYHARCLYDNDPTDNRPPSSEMNLITRAFRLVPVE